MGPSIADPGWRPFPKVRSVLQEERPKTVLIPEHAAIRTLPSQGGHEGTHTMQRGPKPRCHPALPRDKT